MVTLTATVRRDGAWLEVPQHELVPGDIIRLAAGNLVPADARLIEARDLHLQEAALTGESLPAEKEAIASQSTPIQEAAHASQVFLGTSVVSGSGVAVVVRTGRATMLGHIATGLATRAPENEFERGTRQFGLLIMYTVFFLVLFVLLVSLAITPWCAICTAPCARVAFRNDRDRQQFHNSKDIAISLSLEAAEVLELMQWRSGPVPA